MAIVHFYTHETLEKAEPTQGLWQRFRRWLVRKLSPRFGHCGLEINGDEGFELGYSGYKKSGLGLKAKGDHLLEVAEARRPCALPLWPRNRPSLLALWMMLACVLPRLFDNCASYVGRLVYCPGARTPDELYRLLKEHKGAKPIGEE